MNLVAYLHDQSNGRPYRRRGDQSNGRPYRRRGDQSNGRPYRRRGYQSNGRPYRRRGYQWLHDQSNGRPYRRRGYQWLESIAPGLSALHHLHPAARGGRSVSHDSLRLTSTSNLVPLLRFPLPLILPLPLRPPPLRLLCNVFDFYFCFAIAIGPCF